MQVKDEDISTLIELQHNDMELLRVQKAIADLPQRKTIVAARKKIKTIEEKQETVGKLRAKAEEKLAGISEEDGKLAAKQEEAQKAVDSASGYRDVEAHTREMDGYAKRRATLEEDLAAVDAELDKISAVEKQISTALAQLRETESAATAEFQSQGGELKKQEADLTSSHDQIAANLPADLKARYDRAAKHCGGVAVALLRDDACGACRAPIEQGHLIDLKAPCAACECPNRCKAPADCATVGRFKPPLCVERGGCALVPPPNSKKPLWRMRALLGAKGQCGQSRRGQNPPERLKCAFTRARPCRPSCSWCRRSPCGRGPSRRGW